MVGVWYAAVAVIFVLGLLFVLRLFAADRAPAGTPSTPHPSRS